MSQISAKEVMKLRQKTGLSMMECKKALVETSGDAEAAEEHLRKKLKGKMDARTDRAAGEGQIAVFVTPNQTAATIVELRAETDFTAKNEAFVTVAKKIAEMAVESPSGDVAPTDEMTKIVDELRITTGENISIGRIHKIAGEEGKSAFGSYVHHDGKTGVLIQADGSISDETLKQICMHVTAATPRPLGVTPDDIPADMVEKERKFRMEQAIESGKNESIAEKMVEGGMRKFFEDVALMEQPFVVDPTKGKIKDLVGANASVTGFYRWQVGEEE